MKVPTIVVNVVAIVFAKFCILVFWFLYLTPTRAQNIEFNAIWDYQIGSTTFEDIIQDEIGFIWVATQGGLVRYDGYTFTWFTEKGLAGPAVLGLFEDSKGNLWFGNNGAGLFRYDGKTLKNITEEKDELPEAKEYSNIQEKIHLLEK